MFKDTIILDEIQNAPSLFRKLNTYIDENRSPNGLLILTGSQQFQLMKEISDILAGRISILSLETLSTRELVPAFSDKDIANILWKGGYPELWKPPSLDVKKNILV